MFPIESFVLNGKDKHSKIIKPTNIQSTFGYIYYMLYFLYCLQKYFVLVYTVFTYVHHIFLAKSLIC